MKSLLFSLVTFITFTCLFPTQQLFAQDLANVETQMPSREPIQHSDKANDMTSYQPDFKAGQHTAYFQGFDTFVNNHLVYPKIARENSIEGRVEVLLSISEQGKVLSAKIVKSLGFGCDEAALALAKEMPDWSPAMNFGTPVKSKIIVAFDFRLR